MSFIEWLNKSMDVGDAIKYLLITLAIWFLLWHLVITKLFKKYDIIYELMDYGPILAPIASFGIIIFLSLFVGLFLASIQIAIAYGIKMTIVLTAFWGGLAALIVFLIKQTNKKK